MYKKQALRRLTAIGVLFVQLSLGCLFLLLGGCVSLRPPAADNHFAVRSPAERQAQLMPLTAWTMEGAFSVQAPHQTPVIASYRWQQQDLANYRITLSALLNLGQLTFISKGGQVTLTGGNQRPVSASNAESLMQQNLGWSIPVSQLAYWVRGLPSPDSPAVSQQFDSYGHLIALRQAGTQLRWGSYHRYGTIDLPTVLWLTRPDLAAKLVIKNWHIAN